MNLDPELAAVVDAVPAWAGKGIRAVATHARVAGRAYRVEVDGSTFDVRCAGRDTDLLGLDQLAERTVTEAAYAAGLAPEVVAYVPGARALVTRSVAADPVAEGSLERPEVLAAVVEAVRSIHSLAPIRSRFDPFRVVRDHRDTAEIHGARVPAAYRQALHAADRIAVAFGRRPLTPRPCHNDLLTTNVLVHDGRVILVGFGYAGMGDPFFDLGTLAASAGMSEQAQELLLERYLGRVTAAARARVQLMRVMSDFREAMRGVVLQGTRTDAFDPLAHADRHFARCLEGAGDPRFGTWLNDAPEDL